VGRWLRTLANGFEICATVPAAGSEISSGIKKGQKRERKGQKRHTE